ncbi:mucoidy inhibitor MuiA family protein [Iningainema tapete]|uniref:Mucoidy inhibitor MuiA family protein n=1 Tax=Iningainema tapete BLCC-T55 TaxID=2748662 RepID=A0A8J7BZB7_9CYAN|nr:mucoidy inhibitor MuiA family protein [Iningainema tapete BLCC-T55]
MNNPETLSVRKTLNSQIVAVTVYSNQALVTRRSVVSLTGQERELVITPLPDTLETESFRIGGAGVAMRILGVSSERLLSTTLLTERLAQLTRQIQQLEAQHRYLQAQVDALAVQSKFIVGLQEKTLEPFAQSLSRKNLSLSETLDFLNFLGSQYSEYAIATGDCTHQQQEIDKQLQILRQQLEQTQTPVPQESFSLMIAIEPQGAGELELEVSYVVNQASWTPLYDLRINTASNSLNLTYLAEITQTTGEDWNDVAVTLSTAKPGLGTLPPKLQPWYIDVLDKPEFLMRRRAAVPVLTMASAPSSVDEGTETEALEDLAIAQTVVAEVSHQGTVVTFDLTSSSNIKSDGAPHKTTIFNDDFPCSLDYVAMPRLVSFAYLQAKVRNSANRATLLPGKANIFRDNTFVGTTQLENIAPGQEFKLNLGIDEGVKIERDLVERQVDKKLIGNNRKVTYGYRLIITNLLNKENYLNLTEQLPVSRNEQIKVRLTRSNPQIQLGEMGILEWVLTLPPQEKREIYYQFTVEYPSELTVVGLDI